MSKHNSFNYIELPSLDNGAMKSFYGKAFGWTFEDWGQTYVAIHGAGVDGDLIKIQTETRQGMGPLSFYILTTLLEAKLR